MKMLVWLLAALNVVAAIVSLSGRALPPPPAVTEPPATPGARRLQLLSELPTLPPRLDSLPAAPELPPDAAPTPDAVTPEPPAARADAVAPSAPPVSPPLPAQANTAPEPAPQPGPPGDAVASAAAPTGPGCYRTRPLAPDTYQAAGDALRAAGLGEPVLRPEGGARPRYWVYWDGSAADLETTSAKLKAAGAKDWYRTRGPDGAVRLSMGVYGQIDGARRRQRELAAKGVQTAIGESYRPPARLRWVVTAAADAVTAAQDRLRGRGATLEACP